MSGQAGPAGDDAAEPRSTADEYRTREAEMMRAADTVELPSVRAKYLEAADRWRRLAELAEAPSGALRWHTAPPLI